MRCLLPDPGFVCVSMDLAAGEPTVNSHFSQDKHYRYACFDGVGKAPFYEDGILRISDIYLQTMSVSPLTRDKMAHDFKYARFDGRTMADQWLIDDEVVKKYFKKDRQLAKMLCLEEGTLVRVRGRGWLPIEAILPGMEVWDGESWVHTDGAVCNGEAVTIERFGICATEDHLILTAQGWAPIGEARNASKARPATATWSDVWSMARRFFGNSATWEVPLYLGRLWVRGTVETLRQFKGWVEYRLSKMS